MKIIRLHIENFGILQNVDMDFRDGKNELLKDNGWGKSTLAAFIRVMFYGFAGETKKAKKDKERFRMAPWNGGVFGGEIEFETGGKRYLLNRTFTNSSDTFSLKDAETLLDSTDYSERIGEEIFGVDSDSFRRTSYVSQGNLKYEGTNSTINSKVGNITDLDDLGNYDSVAEKIKNYKNNNSPSRNTGKLKKTENEINTLANEVRKKNALLKSADDKRKDIFSERENAETYKKTRLELQKKQDGILIRQSRAGELKHYRDFLAEAEKRRKTAEDKEAVLGEVIPSEEALSELSRENDEVILLAAENKNLGSFGNEERLALRERYFKQNPPEEAEIDRQLENCEELNQTKADIKKAEEKEDEAGKRVRILRDSISDKEFDLAELNRKISQAEEKEVSGEDSFAKKDETEKDFNVNSKHDTRDSKLDTKSTGRFAEDSEDENDKGYGNDALNETDEADAFPKSRLFTYLAFGLLAAGVILLILFFVIHLSNPVLIGSAVLLLAGLIFLIFSMTEHSREKQLKKLREEKKAFLEMQRQKQIRERLRLEEENRRREEENRRREEENRRREEENRRREEENRKLREKMQNDRIEDAKRLRGEIDRLKEQKGEIEAEIDTCAKERETLTDKKKSYENELKGFFEKYNLSFGSDAVSVLHEMKNYLSDYKVLVNEKDEWKRKKEKSAALLNEKNESILAQAKKLGIEGFLTEFGTVSYETLRELIDKKTDAIQEWKNAKREYEEAEKRRKEYLSEHERIRMEAESINLLSGENSTDEDFEAEAENLKKQIAAEGEKISNCEKNTVQYEKDLGEILDEIRAMEDKEEQIREKTEEYEALKKRYDIVSKTGDYLKDAKEHFIANFTQPVKSAFDKYYELMVGTTEFQNSDYRIDANLGITRKEAGDYHDIDLQSDGYADMVGMCIRLALLDVMYKGEKPPVIMDDPFVNLDRNHLDGAKAFLDEVAKEYQILYFTCHESRI